GPGPGRLGQPARPGSGADDCRPEPPGRPVQRKHEARPRVRGEPDHEPEMPPGTPAGEGQPEGESTEVGARDGGETERPRRGARRAHDERSLRAVLELLRGALEP